MVLTDFHIFLESCMQGFDPSYGLVGGLFMMGLVGGFSHCVGMCGPFVLAQTGDHMKKISDLALVPYHFGRIITYITLALIVYSMVNMLTFFSPLRVFIVAPLLAMAGLLFILNGIPKLRTVFPWAMRITLPISHKFVQNLFSRSSNRFVTGLVLGLIPCGMVVGALMASATASSYMMAALSMAAFGVGTIPALFFVALGGRKLQQNFPTKMPAIRAGLMVWGGVWLFAMAGFMIWKGQ